MRDVKSFAKNIAEVGGRVFIVGGAVRDKFMGKSVTDIDLLVVGVSTDVMLSVARRMSRIPVNQVIANAPVFIAKFDDMKVEIAMARIEVSVAAGKAGFFFDSHPGVTLEDDLMRRDFTVNAMAEDVLTGEVFDPFGGQNDIEHGVLRHVSPAFVESPERGFRMMQHAARFPELVSGDSTIALVAEMSKDFWTIAAEQVWLHFSKFFEKGVAPERGFDVLVKSGWINFFPEINVNRIDFDRMRNFTGKVEMMLASVLESMDESVADRFLDRIGCFDKRVRAKAKGFAFSSPGAGLAGVRRLSIGLAKVGLTVGEFCEFRGDDEMMRMAVGDGIVDAAFSPFVSGADILEMGVRQGPKVGQVLAAVFESQIVGEVKNREDAILMAKGLL